MTKYEVDSNEQPHDITVSVLEQIKGPDIERYILDLAKIGGTQIDETPEQPERYAVSRLALSEDDKRGRSEFVRPFMEASGMTVQEHPFGIIGTLPGRNPELAPVVIISHTDSVPRGDMYDGDTGVIGGIKVAEALNMSGYQMERDITVISMTGEESSGFGFALFGSRGMFHGLTDRELDAHIPDGKTIRATLGEEATEVVKQPIVGPGRMIPTPFAVIELHVEQNNTLDEAGIDLGVVEAIAAPVRFSVEFGEKPIEINETQPANAKHLRLQVNGKGDHSGATPMGREKRADGLVETAKFVLSALEQGDESAVVDLGSINVDEEALNKVPGLTTVDIRISGENAASVDDRVELLQEILMQQSEKLGKPGDRFDEGAMTLLEIDESESDSFFKHEDVVPRQRAALSLIVDVNEVATMHADQNVVGTIGTYKVSPDGKISLGLDVRGIDKASRDSVIEQMQLNAQSLQGNDSANFGESLPGSGDPVTLDAELVQITNRLIADYGLGSSVIMFSAAGHDAQNSAKAGIPTVMIFCQSNAGGVAHNPDAYTRPENLAQGVRALAALTIDLAT